MVYCGKPSTSCRQCRKRNIKCDKKTPSCGQCLRAHLQCPGYHNPNQLVFRHETQATIQRVSERQLPALLTPIAPSVFDRAKELFVTRYVLDPSSRLTFLIPFRPPQPFDAYFTASVVAVMFASLFHEVKSLAVLERARRAYGSALVLVNRALRSPEVVAKDVTIATVLILDLFERFTAREGFAEVLAVKHLQGAIAIFKLRGGNQFADPNIMAMFQYLSLDFLLSCLRYGMQIPPDFLDLRRQAHGYVDADDYEWQFADLMIRLAQFRVALKSGLISNIEASATLHQLDDDYFRIIQESSECLSSDISKQNCSYNATRTFLGIGPGILLPDTKHVTLVRNELDELLQQNGP